MKITQQLTLDFTTPGTIQYVSAKQGDQSSRFIQITLTHNGAPYTLPEGAMVKFRAQKPDGTMILNPAAVGADGTVTVELTDQTLAVCGSVLADLCITDSQQSILSTVSFVIQVDTAPTGDLSESSGEFLALNQLVTRAEKAAADASGKAAEAEQSSATAAAKAAESASAARQSENARAGAIAVAANAKQSADTASASADTASAFAQTATQVASVASQSAQAAQAAAKQAEGAKNGIAEAEARARQSADTATQKAQDAAASAQKAQQAANAAADKLPLAGGRMTGTIDMGGQGITNLKAPANDGDAVSKGSLLELVYPIGSVYMSANDTSPAQLFGGSWVKVEGKFLLGASADHPAASSGGEAVHALTAEELPSLRGEVWFPTDRQTYAMISGTSGIFKPNRDHTQQDEFKPTTGYGTALSDTATYGFKVDVGGNAPHNNMPPYFAVNIWRRIK